MPRAPKVSRDDRQKAIVKAMEAVEAGSSVYKAAKDFKIPCTTLWEKVRGKSSINAIQGPSSIFSPAEENILIDWILRSQAIGFPVSKEQVILSAARLIKELERENPFKNGIPGKKWLNLFCRRHPNISFRTPQNLTISRGKVTRGQISTWFSEIKLFFSANDLMGALKDPSRVFNADEAAFFFAPKGNKALCERGSKDVYSLVNTDEKECLTVLLNANAAGKLPPPMVIFKYVRVPKAIAESVPSDWAVGLTDSGWMTGESFYEYMANIFDKWLTENNIMRPVIFFLDGHTSHQTLHLSRFCLEKSIWLVTFTPNCTHLLQPMDVSVFKALKGVWKKEVTEWRVNNQQPTLGRKDFCPLLKKTIDKCVTPSIIQSGFRKCGLVPFDPEAVDYSKLRVQDEINAEQNPVVTEHAQVIQERAEQSTKPEVETALKHINQFNGDDKLEFFLSCKNQSNWPELIDREDHRLFVMWRHFYDENYFKAAEMNLSPSKTPTLSEIVNIECTSLDLTLPVESELDSAVSSILAEGSSTVSVDLLSDPHVLLSSLEMLDALPLCDTDDWIITERSTSSSVPISLPPPEVVKENITEPSASSAAHNSLPLPKVAIETMKESGSAPYNCSVAGPSGSSISQLKATSTVQARLLPPSPEVPAQANLTPSSSEVPDQAHYAPKESTGEDLPSKNLVAIETPSKKPTEGTPSKAKSKRKFAPKKLEFSPSKNNIPSPFKKALFWPDRLTNERKGKKKEKVPAVSTSPAWLSYYEKKEKEKQEAEEAKKERKRIREEKKHLKRKAQEEKKTKNRRRKVEDKFDDTDELSEEDADEPSDEDLTSTTDDEQDEQIVPKKNQFVITEYEEEFFPGQVIDVGPETAKVKSMAPAGIGVWKWPIKDDVCQYNFTDIKAVIKSPTLFNKRGHFKVPEMKDFGSWSNLM